MGKREVIDCDACDVKDVSPSYTINLWVGTSKDAVNNRSDDWIQPDVCQACLDAFISHLLTNVVTKQQQLEIAGQYFPNAERH